VQAANLIKYYLLALQDLRGFMIQSTGTSGIAFINGLANATTVSVSTNTQVYICSICWSRPNRNFKSSRRWRFICSKSVEGIVDGVGVTGNTSALNITLFIDK
jgi:hypothetical protein